MKPLTCEMCGSSNLIKQDGVFVCQSCGTKYSVEEAKKMMIEGTVDVKGTVKIDDTDELKNLYEIARRAKDSNNCESAAKYYDMILVKEPKSWEANFYVPFFSAMTYKIEEIYPVSERVCNNYTTTFNLIKNSLSGGEYSRAIEEVITKSKDLSKTLFNASVNQFRALTGLAKDDEISANKYENIKNAFRAAISATKILLALGDALYELDKNTYRNQIISLWKDGTKNLRSIVRKRDFLFSSKALSNLDDMSTNEHSRLIKAYDIKIKNLDPEYKGSGACYIATAVYGSYDCEEVWTLRRFRDYTLEETWYGRIFVHIYYAISPTLVKWFGHKQWFKKMWKKPLDFLVAKLQSQGIENTPYNDRWW